MLYSIDITSTLGKGVIQVGGKPNPATPKDQRLKVNNPNAGKPAAPKPAPKTLPVTPKKGGK